jgi:hypothetical protein
MSECTATAAIDQSASKASVKRSLFSAFISDRCFSSLLFRPLLHPLSTRGGVVPHALLRNPPLPQARDRSASFNSSWCPLTQTTDAVRPDSRVNGLREHRAGSEVGVSG